MKENQEGKEIENQICIPCAFKGKISQAKNIWIGYSHQWIRKGSSSSCSKSVIPMVQFPICEICENGFLEILIAEGIREPDGSVSELAK